LKIIKNTLSPSLLEKKRMATNKNIQGRIITFYSYKGGTGRTMALANVACLLAKITKVKNRVLMIDWDLEAPGLHRFFSTKFKKRYGTDCCNNQDFISQPGLIEFFRDKRKAILKNPSFKNILSEEETKEILESLDLSKYILQSDIPNLSFIKAGAFDENYSSRVNTFDWEGFYIKVPLFFKLLAEKLTKLYKYILIDSRTGLTDTSGICTMLMPEYLVVVFTPNKQSLSNLPSLIVDAATFRKASDDFRPLIVYPLPSRIEIAENDLRKLWRYGNRKKKVDGYQNLFENLFREIYDLSDSECKLDKYFDDIQIQHLPRYAYGEEIAVLEKHSKDRLSITQSYENFTKRLFESINPWEESILSVPKIYIDWIVGQCSNIDSSFLYGNGSVSLVKADDIYVPLHAIEQDYKSLDKKPGAISSAINIENTISKRDVLLIIGEPGSGKTMFLKRIANNVVNKSDYLNLGGWLPILIFASDLIDFFQQKNTVDEQKIEIESILSDYFNKSSNGLDIDLVKRFCAERRAIFLLDGLDELPSPQRNLLVNSFHNYIIKNSGNKFIFTTRPFAVEGSLLKRFADNMFKLLPFNHEQITNFIKNYYTTYLSDNLAFSEQISKNLIATIQNNPSISFMADNPLLLTELCIIYHEGKELPEQEAILYSRVINNLISRRFSDSDKIIEFLENLAFYMLSNSYTAIDKIDAIQILSKTSKKHNSENNKEYRNRLQQEFYKIEEYTGLLRFLDGQYSFVHLSIQEFLTARYLVSNSIDYDKAINEFWEEDHFKEVIKLYISYLSTENKRWANKIIENALKEHDIPPYRKWFTASRSIFGIYSRRRDKNVLKLTTMNMLEVINKEKDPRLLYEAGNILGLVGDPRDLKDFVFIKGGQYNLSSGKYKLKNFEISKFPVTNMWFDEFIKAGGYSKKEFWTSDGFQWLNSNQYNEPEYWLNKKLNCSNFPVTGVSWYEAMAFTKWLTDSMNDGFIYKLPSETEWEAAACGFEQRMYPWGDEYENYLCNNSESGIGTVATVGIFKKGDTPEGVSDLSGNVWEWTETLFTFSKISSDIHGEIRSKKADKKVNLLIVRGGSWDLGPEFCRNTSTNKLTEYYRNMDCGFRCVRTPSM